MKNKLLSFTAVSILTLLSVIPAYASSDENKNSLILNPAVLYGCFAVLLCIIAILAIKLIKSKKQTAATIAETEKSQQAFEEELLVKQIKEGLENKEFKMYLQFIVDNKTKHIVSAEALSRWESSNGETILPFKYIGIMEKHGLIAKLDYYMLEMACKKLCEWKDSVFKNLTISCNFTRITISEKDFVSKITEIADKYDFDRSKLQIEITEDSLEKNLDIAMNNITKAKEYGFRIALDDIGSGYTSFISLCEYPIDVVKIDRNLLLLADIEKGKKLFLGIISLSRYLNLEVVCEGVETEEQNSFISNSDCDYIQGWYYSKALSENKAEEFAKEYMLKFQNVTA